MAKRSKKKQARLAAAKARELPAQFRERVEAARIEFRALARAVDLLGIAQEFPSELHDLAHLDADMAEALCVMKHQLHEVDVGRMVSDTESSLVAIPSARERFLASLSSEDRGRLEAQSPAVRTSLGPKDAYIDVPAKLPSRRERQDAARAAQEERIERLCDLRAEFEEDSIEEIGARLDDLGLGDVVDRFAELAAGQTSALAVAERLMEERGVSDYSEDIVITAIDHLWRRLCPNRPSVEMLDDLIQEGYALQERDRLEAAADVWWRVWQTLRARFGPEMTTMEATDSVFSGTQSVFNWCQDLDDLLTTMAARSQAAASRGLEYCDQWLAQFTAESELTLVNFHRSRAEYLLALDRIEDAIAEFEGVVERWPGNPWGHIALADLYAGFHRRPIRLVDVGRAKAHLESARRVASDPQDVEHIRDRMADLRHLPPQTQS